MSLKIELITSKTCPFAQRVAIVLHEKKIDFTTTYVDLQNKPAWFLQLSPLGKIPILRVEGQPLFESAVINEYLDEAYPPHLHPDNLLQRAVNRAWVEFGSDLIMAFVHLTRAADKLQFTTQQQVWEQKVARLEAELQPQPFFNGAHFSLVDAAWAPLLIRILALQKHGSLQFLTNSPKMQAWAEHLAEKKSVQLSIASDYIEALLARTRTAGHYFATQYL